MISKAGFINLNVVRALSGFVVLLAHFCQLFVLPVAGHAPLTDLAMHAAEPAVFAFFVLSGLLIALSIEQNLKRSGHFAWKSYAVSRFARIYPALVVSVLLCIALHHILSALGISGPMSLSRASDVVPSSRTDFMVPAPEVVFTLLQTYAFGPGAYLTVNGPLWSLSYEVGFYLAAGLLMAMIKGQGLSRLGGSLGLCGLAGMAVANGKIQFLHYATLWSLGVWVYLVLSERSWVSKSFAFAGCTIPNVVLGATLGGGFIRNYLSSLAIALGLLVLSRSSRVVLGPVAKMADSTYTLYLFHFPLLLFVYALIRDVCDRSPSLYFACAILVTLAIVPVCAVLARSLENRRWWEAILLRPAK